MNASDSFLVIIRILPCITIIIVPENITWNRLFRTILIYTQICYRSISTFRRLHFSEELFIRKTQNNLKKYISKALDITFLLPWIRTAAVCHNQSNQS